MNTTEELRRHLDRVAYANLLEERWEAIRHRALDLATFPKQWITHKEAMSPPASPDEWFIRGVISWTWTREGHNFWANICGDWEEESPKHMKAILSVRDALVMAREDGRLQELLEELDDGQD